MSQVIETRELTRRFGGVAALSSVDLAVAEGAIYALVGANGAGKTTLIKLLMNILRPTSGRAKVLGTEARDLAGKGFNRIGYVSENQEMPEWMTVGGLLEYCRPFYPTWDPALAQQLNQGAATLIAAVFLPVVGRFGYFAMFAFWGICTVAYFAIAAFFLPETKGRTLEEIEQYFEGENPGMA